MTTPSPTSQRHQLRAATSLRRAAELVGRRCALHHGQLDQAPPDPRIDLPSHCVADVGRALGQLLDWQLGPVEALRRVRAIGPADVDAYADLVAESVGWDTWAALRLQRLAVRHHRDQVDLSSMPETPDAAPVIDIINSKKPTDNEEN